MLRAIMRHLNSALIYATMNCEYTKMKSLLAQGADVNTLSTFSYAGSHCFGDTPLIISANKGNTRGLDLLLDHQANIDYMNPSSDRTGTALIHAVLYDRVKTVKKLLDSHAAVDQVNRQNRTPLFVASNQGMAINRSIINLLLDNGADVNHLSDEQHTPLSSICFTLEFQHELVDLYLEHGGNLDMQCGKDKKSISKIIFDRYGEKCRAYAKASSERVFLLNDLHESHQDSHELLVF